MYQPCDQQFPFYVYTLEKHSYQENDTKMFIIVLFIIEKLES